MRRHGPVIAHCTDSEDFPGSTALTVWIHNNIRKYAFGNRVTGNRYLQIVFVVKL